MELVDTKDNAHCPLKDTDASADPRGAGTFGRVGESHVYVAVNCTPKFLNYGSVEYRVWSLDKGRYLFKSETAF